MKYPLSRGNLIQWNWNNRIISIYDHSYNSSFNSLIMMLDQVSQNKPSIIIFTPLRECDNPNEKYTLLENIITKNQLKCWIYDPYYEIHSLNYKELLNHNNQQNYDNYSIPNKPIITAYYFDNKNFLKDDIINFIKQSSGHINIFIKGANSFNMIEIVCDLLEWLGDEAHE